MRERMKPVDVAWLRMERPENLVTIGALLLFDEPIPEGRLAEMIEKRLLAFPRFKQRAVDPGGMRRPTWETVEPFDWRPHVERVTLPAGGDEALRKLVGEKLSEPLDRSRPLWHILAVDGLGRGTALLVRIHHAVGDGGALVRVLLAITDEPEDLSAEMKRRAEVRRRGGPVSRAARMLSALPAAVFLPSDPATAFRGPLGREKRVAWSRPISLDHLKATAKRQSATVNDLASAAVAGALRRYLRDRGRGRIPRAIHAVIPVDLRPPDSKEVAGNRFGLAYLRVPLAAKDARRRLALAHQAGLRLRQGAQASLFLRTLAAAGLTTAAIEGYALRFFARKATFVMTNVLGPRRVHWIAGSPLRSLLLWNPITGGLGLGISVLSYGGEVRVGAFSDAGLVPDPERLVALIEEELAAFETEAARPTGRPLASRSRLPI